MSIQNVIPASDVAAALSALMAKVQQVNVDAAPAGGYLSVPPAHTGADVLTLARAGYHPDGSYAHSPAEVDALEAVYAAHKTDPVFDGHKPGVPEFLVLNGQAQFGTRFGVNDYSGAYKDKSLDDFVPGGSGGPSGGGN